MRLLLVSQDFPPDVGGIETYAVKLAQQLAERCEHLMVLAPRRPGAGKVDRRLPFPVCRLPVRRDLLGLAAVPVMPVLARRHDFTAAFHTQWPTVIASLVARRLVGRPRRVAVAAHGRELLLQPFRRALLCRAYDRLRGQILRNADVLLPVSQYTAGLLRAQVGGADRIGVVPNGTDPERFFPDVEGATTLRQKLEVEENRVVFSVGRLVPRKGFDTVIRALPQMMAATPGLVYLVAGSGPDRPRLERLARDLGVAGRVRFLGRVSHETLRALYSAADVFAMPSRQSEPDVEGFGIVFLEAGACGTPVVGARTGGIPDAIDDGETGFLVAPNAPEALAAACTRLLRDATLAARLGAAGRARVERTYTWNRAAGRVYEALCQVG